MPSLSPQHSTKKTGPWPSMTCVASSPPKTERTNPDDAPRAHWPCRSMRTDSENRLSRNAVLARRAAYDISSIAARPSDEPHPVGFSRQARNVSARRADVAGPFSPPTAEKRIKKAGPLAEAGPECVPTEQYHRPQASCRYFSLRLRVTSTGQVAPSSTRVTTLPMITFSRTERPREPMTMRSQSSSSWTFRIA